MSDAAPTQIGPYTDAREFGRGGMGVVYIARDERLGRDVALKSLPPHFAEDAERLERFEREARALAQLNHPNISGIHGVEDGDDGRRFLVLEYVEGQTLGDRLERAPIPLDETIDLCTQIAAGVEAAHEAGVIHRDLKPDNIKITPDGAVKVLDFGLARIDEGSSSTGIPSDPAATVPQRDPTVAGRIMGTPAYMSPEQARGRRVDKRADIWSFGAILYECLTGAKLFVGESAGDTMGAVLHKEMDLSALPASTPVGVVRVLKRCLERDRRERYRDMGDVRHDLAHARDVAETATSSRGVPWLAAILLAVVLGALGAGAALLTIPASPPESPRSPIRVSLPIPFDFDSVKDWDLSTDGKQIVFCVNDPTDPDATHAVYVRALDSTEFRRLYTSPNQGLAVSFTPDGRDVIAFETREGAVERGVRIDVATGGVVPLIQSAQQEFLFRDISSNAFINDTEAIVEGDEIEMENRNLYAFNVRDGSTRLVATLPEELGRYHQFLFVVPGSTHALFAVARTTPETGAFKGTVDAFNLETGAMHTVLDRVSFSATLVAPDVLVFTQPTGETFATGFDASTVRTTGEVVPVIDSATDVIGSYGAGHFAYRPLLGSLSHLVHVNPDGSARRITRSRDAYQAFFIEVSPDGSRCAVNVAQGDSSSQSSLVVIDTSTGEQKIVDTGLVRPRRWLEDGRLLYAKLNTTAGTSNADSEWMLHTWTPGGGTQTIFGHDADLLSVAITSDARYLLANRRATVAGSTSQILAFHDLEDPNAPPVEWTIDDSIFEIRFSPNNRLLAFSRNTGTAASVFVARFEPGEPLRAVRVSSRPTSFVRWSPSGTMLLYRHTDTLFGTGPLMAARIETDQNGEPFVASTPSPAIDGDRWAFGPFGASPDGGFVMIEMPEATPGSDEPGLFLNAAADLRRRIGLTQ